MPDYDAKIRALRRKAADPTVTAPERKLLEDKANELAEKVNSGNLKSQPTDDTTVTSRDGNPFYRSEAQRARAAKESWDAVWDLFYRQGAWNKPPPDEEDLVEEKFKYEEDEDYGYDMFEGDDW